MGQFFDFRLFQTRQTQGIPMLTSTNKGINMYAKYTLLAMPIVLQ